MGPGTALLLQILLLGVFLYGLFFVVRAAVEGGVRRALEQSLLRPSTMELVEERNRQQQAETEE